jgi:hypothetical protein
MALSITQTPATASLAQSPIIFTVAESNLVNLTSESFQYVGELYYWTGSVIASGSSDYTITKYPNSSNVGIFDLNRIINSTLTDLLQQNPSNVVYFACDFYTQFQTIIGTYVTGSHLKSNLYKALDGYGIFPETIGQGLNTFSTFYPLLTDGPVTQSAFLNNKGVSGVAVGTLGGVVADRIIYSGSVGNGTYFLSSSTSTSGQIDDYPIGIAQSGFPLTGSIDWYTIQPFNGETALGSKIRYEIVCPQKYPNVRIKWKNRFGQFDYLNFNMINRQSFSTTKRTYQPQLGSWEGSTFGYQSYDSSNLNYINDSIQNISVNTDWLDEDYNDIFKQLLVSDEIYWIYDEANNLLRPLTVETSNMIFKTGVVDKLIQYQIDFKFGQPYKLIM